MPLLLKMIKVQCRTWQSLAADEIQTISSPEADIAEADINNLGDASGINAC